MIHSPMVFILLLLSLTTGVQSPAGISVTDDLGRTVTLPGRAERVISLAPSITESLFAIGAGSQVAGVTNYCNFPPEAKAKPRVGGMINPSMEAILSLRPDLIVLSMEGNIREDFTRLTHLGVPVFVTNPREFAGIHRSLEQLGTLTGRTHEAELVIRSMRDREDSIRSLVTGKPVRTLLIVSLQPLIVVGRNTFLNQLLELAGSENLAAHLPATYPTYSRETLLQENPDVLIVMSDILHSVDDLPRMFPEWRDLSAIRHGNVSRVDPDLVSRPGPRAIDGLEALYHILHGKHQ